MGYGFAVGLLAGAVLLGSLAIWQGVRAGHRAEAIEIATERLQQSPQTLPRNPTRGRHFSLPVRLEGRFDHAAEQHLYAVLAPWGAGFRVITPFELSNGRRVLVERGFLPQKIPPRLSTQVRPTGRLRIEGILSFPRERNLFTPEPAEGLWYARDVPALAKAARASPVLVTARPARTGAAEGNTSGVTLWPLATTPQVDRVNIHIGYMLTWAGLLVAWLVIGTMLWRKNKAASQGRAPAAAAGHRGH